MPCWSAGSTVAATAALAGEDAPALITVGKDGAVFYWMYDPAPPNAHPTPQGYAKVPGKHRKRKAPDTDPIQPRTAATKGDRVDQGNKLRDAEGDEHDSSSDVENTDGSEGGEESGVGQAQAAVADPTEDAAEMLAGTSGRAHGDQQQREEQMMSFAGEWQSSVAVQEGCNALCNAGTCCCCMSVSVFASVSVHVSVLALHIA